MSVLLTATKNVWKRTSKPKRKRRSSSKSGSDFTATPPVSNARTTVWYWSLDGVSTTLMYSRASGEIWCNGAVLDTEDTDPQSGVDSVLYDGCTVDVQSVGEAVRRLGDDFTEMRKDCVYVTQEEFSEETDSILFTIRVNETESSYSCRLVRIPRTSSADCQPSDDFTYRLYVDQTPIMEHAVDAAMRVGVLEEVMVSETTGTFPPSYDEAVDDDERPPPYDH